MRPTLATPESKVAILIDCDNVPPDILDYALRMAAQFGRVVVRRGYGNQSALTNKWQEVLVHLAFTPCLQYQYAARKNTADIALALDALETLFDERADTFCLVTSDSDFAYLCRKLRERGASVCIVGEVKTPNALRNACDQFFEWTPHEPKPESVNVTNATEQNDSAALSSAATPSRHGEAAETEPTKPAQKRRPQFVVEAVELLANNTADGDVGLGPLGQYLKRMDPGFSPQAYGHSGLLNMIRTYDWLTLHREEGGQWSVSLSPNAYVLAMEQEPPSGA